MLQRYKRNNQQQKQRIVVSFRALNPRFLIPHFGQKTVFRARNAGMNEIKSGIPCSGCACILVNYLQDGFEKNESSCPDSRARNPRFYFVHAGTKPRFLTKKGHPKSGIPCSGRVIACVCSFVSPSCKYVTKIQTHRSEKSNASSCHCVRL
jgi:hypothetical protein